MQSGQNAAVSGFDKVTQIGSERNAVAEIVMTLDELAEELSFGVVNQAKPERFQIGNGGRVFHSGLIWNVDDWLRTVARSFII